VSLRCGVGVTADWDGACPLGVGSGGSVDEKREERVLAGASASGSSCPSSPTRKRQGEGILAQIS
jgi:hypothetical protein